jgi:nucleoid-associated protein YejK
MTKFFSVVVFITSFSVLYVYQQSEIFRLAYLGQKKQATFNELLDKNTALRYNIRKNSSLVAIGNRINSSKEFQMPDNYRYVKFISSRDGLKLADQNQSREGLLARIFSLKREAQAKTINP